MGHAVMKNQLPLSAQGTKHDADKPPMELLSSLALTGLADVLAYGAKRYGKHNWRKGISYSRLYSATLRHMLAFNAGEDFDQESDKCHIYHALCNLMFLAEMYETRKDLDDRYSK